MDFSYPAPCRKSREFSNNNAKIICSIERFYWFLMIATLTCNENKNKNQLDMKFSSCEFVFEMENMFYFEVRFKSMRIFGTLENKCRKKWIH